MEKWSNHKNSMVVLMTSLRDIVRSPLWWVFVFVMWVLALLGIFSPPQHFVSVGHPLQTNVGPALDLTVLVIVMQVVERLIPQPQPAQKKQHTTRKSVR